MAQRDLRAKIGLVPQKAVLFTGTIADNIRYGKGDATDEKSGRLQTLPRQPVYLRHKKALLMLSPGAAQTFPAVRSSSFPLPALAENLKSKF